MKFNRKTRGIAKYLTHLKPGEEYWMGLPAEIYVSTLKELGFSVPLIVGERLLPAASFGPACRRNALGDEIVHRDRPMETAYRQAEWHWTEFRGRYDTEDRSKIVDVPYERYPRTHVPPHAVELEIRKSKNEVHVAVGPFVLAKDDDRATNTANVFIEIFGECVVLRHDMTAWEKAPVRQMNWELLPPGKNPWASAQPALKQFVRKAEEGNQPVIRARFEAIGGYEPEFVAIGTAGFDGYVVFGFPRLGLCILECRSVNNATYVLDENSWEAISILTKAEILNANLQRDRLVHRENWFNLIANLLRAQSVKKVVAK
ncbi:hypothetical protein [Sulfuricaulis sp.]|jgi:hypothetical protein|uniref:hypothetical protein n=1 Tax=Sulfuricaulis sp. TaxID=2003553 RepID=UPI00355A063A